MSLYVKVENGKVVEGPKSLSHDHAASPNIKWKLPQMKANGFCLVELPSLNETQEIDYDNPEILEDKVKYKTKKKSLVALKELKKEKIKGKARRIVNKKYSLENQVFASLNLFSQAYLDQMKLDIKKIIDEEYIIQANLDIATTEESLDAVNTDFSEI